MLTLLAANQKPTSVARVCRIRSSNDHHTSVCPSSQQSGVDDHPEAYLVANQKPASVARVCGIQSSSDRHTNFCPSPSNLEWMSLLRFTLQTPIADHHSSRDKALDREDGSQLLAVQCKK
ncbi:hypothetical protein Fmac_028758 [Flemingia macrophylla]|uniref:Uncharacterized protein n=1 Tax=Flemingia macrophylla TaxID=520843 RepID=A0ABD1L8F3_9FABA